MSRMPGYWRDMTTEELFVLDGVRVIAPLPVGAIEQHGPYMAVWTLPRRRSVGSRRPNDYKEGCIATGSRR